VSAIQSLPAPPIVRRIGYYFLVLSVLSLWALIAIILRGDVPWYQLIGAPVYLGIALGLIREKRWAYVAALVVAGINALPFLGALVFNVVWPSGAGLAMAVVFLFNLVMAAPPLLLLGEAGRNWFKTRELQDA